MTYYWLSFVDDARPKGQRFLGGCLVEATSGSKAVMEAWKQKCNPGGEVAIVKITSKANVAKFQLNHLYSRAEMVASGEYRSLDDAIKDGDVQ